MRQRITIRACGVVVLLLSTAAGLHAEDRRKPAHQTLSQLSQEVAALESLYALDVTRPQLETLQKIARSTAAPLEKREEGKVSPEFRSKLSDLRTALVEAKNDEQIGKLLDKIEELRDREKPELDDETEVTEEAIDRAPQVLRLL